MFNDKTTDCSGHLSSDHLLNTRLVSLTGVFISLRIDLIWIVLNASLIHSMNYTLACRHSGTT